MQETQQNYFEWIDIWDDWIADWVFEEQLRTKANVYLEKSWLTWDAKTQLANALWDLLQTWDIDKGKLEEWYNESISRIKLETWHWLEIGIIDNFWLSEQEVARLKEYSDYFDLDIFSALNNYRKYIEENFDWKLSHQIVTKIQLSIGRRFLQLSSIIEELRQQEIEQYWNLDSFKDAKWVINARMQESLQFIDNKLLPSASLYAHFWRIESNSWVLQDWPWNLNMLSKYSREWDPVGLSFTWIDKRLAEIEEMFQADIDLEWNFNEWVISTQDIYDASDPEQVRRYFHGRKIEKVEWVSILNESDQEIQRNVECWIMWCCLLSICPGAWEILDVQNLVSNEGEFISLLRKVWLIPDGYRMPPNMIDTIITSLWLIASLLTLGLAWRAVKMAKLTKVLTKFWWDISDALRWIQMMARWLWEAWGRLLGSIWDGLHDLWLSITWQHFVTPEWVNLWRDNSLSRLWRRVEWVVRVEFTQILKRLENIDIHNPPPDLVRQISWITNQAERMEIAWILLEKVWWNLDASKRLRILSSHRVWEWRQWARVFDYTYAEKYQKWRILMQKWEWQMTRQEAQILLDFWVCGVIENFVDARWIIAPQKATWGDIFSKMRNEKIFHLSNWSEWLDSDSAVEAIINAFNEKDLKIIAEYAKKNHDPERWVDAYEIMSNAINRFDIQYINWASLHVTPSMLQDLLKVPRIFVQDERSFLNDLVAIIESWIIRDSYRIINDGRLFPNLPVNEANFTEFSDWTLAQVWIDCHRQWLERVVSINWSNEYWNISTYFTSTHTDLRDAFSQLFEQARWWTWWFNISMPIDQW